MTNMTHILLSAGYSQTLRTDGSGGISLVQPPNNHRQTNIRSVTFAGSVTTVVGAPSTWSLEARFQILLPHSSGYQFSRPRWIDCDADFLGAIVNKAEILPNGSIRIARSDDGDTLSFDYAITIPELHVDAVRLRFYPAFSGGTDPGFRMALTMTEKE